MGLTGDRNEGGVNGCCQASHLELRLRWDLLPNLKSAPKNNESASTYDESNGSLGWREQEAGILLLRALAGSSQGRAVIGNFLFLICIH